jgi:hypothetical protein
VRDGSWSHWRFREDLVRSSFRNLNLPNHGSYCVARDVCCEKTQDVPQIDCVNSHRHSKHAGGSRNSWLQICIYNSVYVDQHFEQITDQVTAIIHSSC